MAFIKLHTLNEGIPRLVNVGQIVQVEPRQQARTQEDAQAGIVRIFFRIHFSGSAVDVRVLPDPQSSEKLGQADDKIGPAKALAYFEKWAGRPAPAFQ